MNVLAIDSSTQLASLALSTHGEMFCVSQDNVKTHAKQLLPMIDSLLTRADLGIQHLDAIVFGQGPGSFTGLRVACSIAKGLAYAHDIPLMPVSSLAAIAFKARKETGHKDALILSLMDARMNELYWSLYHPHEFVQSQEQVSSAKAISLNEDLPVVLAGVGFEAYFEQFSSSLKQDIVEQLVIFPEASAMIELANTGVISKVSASDAQPVYIRNKVTQGESRG